MEAQNTRQLPEELACRLCQQGDTNPHHPERTDPERRYGHLWSHLKFMHDVTPDAYDTNQPLFTRSYSEKRRRIASRKDDLARFMGTIEKTSNKRAAALTGLALLDFISTGIASRLTGLSEHTFQRAVREGRNSQKISPT